jgi:flagellar motility protein MotE (MotC chaperone)
MAFSRVRLLPLSAAALAVLLMVDGARFFLTSFDALTLNDTALAKDVLGGDISRALFAKRGVTAVIPDIITGATDKPSGEAEKAGKAPSSSTTETAPSLPDGPNTDRTLLERLSERRQALEKQEKDLSEREGLLAAAEKQLEARMAELKAMDDTVKADMARKDADLATLKPLIIMYEAMKPKDAARIFEKLDLKAVLPIASGMNPKKFSEVLAQIDPTIAGKLTVGLAAAVNSQNGISAGKADLPELADISTPKTR